MDLSWSDTITIGFHVNAQSMCKPIWMTQILKCASLSYKAMWTTVLVHTRGVY